MSQEIEVERARRAETETGLAAKESEQVRLQEEMEGMRRQLEAKSLEFASLEGKLQEGEHSLVERSAQAVKLEAELTSLRDLVETHQGDLARASVKLKECEERLAEAVLDAKQRADELAARTSEVENLAIEKENLRSHNVELEADKCSRDLEFASLMDEISSLNAVSAETAGLAAEKEQVEKDLLAASDKIHELEARLMCTGEELANARAELSERTDLVEKTSETHAVEVKGLRDRLDEAKAALQECEQLKIAAEQKVGKFRHVCRRAA